MNCHPDRSVAKWRACPERSRMGICSSAGPSWKGLNDRPFALTFAEDLAYLVNVVGRTSAYSPEPEQLWSEAGWELSCMEHGDPHTRIPRLCREPADFCRKALPGTIQRRSGI